MNNQLLKKELWPKPKSRQKLQVHKVNIVPANFYLDIPLIDDINQSFEYRKHDVVLAQGDTTTVMTIAMECFYHHRPFDHVDADLNTWYMETYFPKKMITQSYRSGL